jgi:hypothetical protein
MDTSSLVPPVSDGGNNKTAAEMEKTNNAFLQWLLI